MKRGKPGPPPATPTPTPTPTSTMPTAEDWLARIAALDATHPPAAPPRLRNTRKAKRRKAFTVMAMLVLLALLAIALAVAVQLMWVR